MRIKFAQKFKFRALSPAAHLASAINSLLPLRDSKSSLSSRSSFHSIARIVVIKHRGVLLLTRPATVNVSIVKNSLISQWLHPCARARLRVACVVASRRRLFCPSLLCICTPVRHTRTNARQTGIHFGCVLGRATPPAPRVLLTAQIH